MNRAEKRKQAKLAKHKPNRSNARYENAITRLHKGFDTIDRLMLAIKGGELNWSPEGYEIMGLDGEPLDVLSGLNGWIEYWNTLADDLALQYDGTALERLARSLKYDMPLTMTQVDAACAVVEVQRRLFRAIPQEIRQTVLDKVRASIARENETRELLRSAVMA